MSAFHPLRTLETIETQETIETHSHGPANASGARRTIAVE